MPAFEPRDIAKETDRIARACRRKNVEYRLRYSDMDPRIIEAVRNSLSPGFSGTKCPKVLRSDGTGLKRYSPWLYCEEVAQIFEMRRHDLIDVRLIPYQVSSGRLASLETKTHWKMRIPELSKGVIPLVAGDLVVLESCDGKLKSLKIEETQGDYVLFGDVSLHSQYNNNAYLFSTGIPFIRCQEALDAVMYDRKMERVFDDLDVNVSNTFMTESHKKTTDELEARLKALNECQRVAVESILSAECRPYPYIIFGPPGTGKTATIIEAIVQIYNREPCAKVLLCANSNLCVDHLFQKLKDTGMILGQDVQRLTTGDRFDDLSRRSFARVVVTTNISAGRLEQDFRYVFLDEAGHAHIPESLVPWSKLIPFGCMVLAGDPYQLGPVVKLRMRGNPLEQSVLERFFTMKHYKKEKDGYDSRFITKLNISYRCDPRILEPSNRLFYDSELTSKGKTPPALLKVLGLDYPIVHLSCISKAVRPPGSTSWYNQGEIDVCMDLVKILYGIGIEPDQIGLVSPYALQTNEMSRALCTMAHKGVFSALDKLFRHTEPDKAVGKPGDQNPISSELPAKLQELQINGKSKKSNWACKVDTVDAFQGDEREIMIISTVRTARAGSDQRLDFLNDRRRFNVSVSRAKWLVFIVGDPRVLRSGDWATFIENAYHLFGRE